MLDKLIPWKRKHDAGNGLRVQHDNDPITALRRDFDNLLSRFWDDSGLPFRDNRNWLSASVGLDENDKEYVLTAELPGFEPADIDVKVSGNMLTVKAEHKEETDGSNGRLRRYGSYYESFTLPAGVNASAIEANYHSGVLEVHVPKDESTPSKRITVKAA